MKVRYYKTKHVQGQMTLIARIAACWSILTTRNVFVITMSKKKADGRRRYRFSFLCEDSFIEPWTFAKRLIDKYAINTRT